MSDEAEEAVAAAKKQKTDEGSAVTKTVDDEEDVDGEHAELIDQVAEQCDCDVVRCPELLLRWCCCDAARANAADACAVPTGHSEGDVGGGWVGRR